MNKIKVFALILVCTLLFSGCGKENKYVNVGVNMSTAGMSLYLTNTVQGFSKVSSYVLFAENSEEAVERVRMKKHGIDITYLPAEDLSLIKAGDDLKVVFIDCFTESGKIKGVWVANVGWLTNAPTYSYRFIKGLARSVDYRTDHLNMNYSEALAELKGVRDIDWDKYPEVMEYCAAYATANNEVLSDTGFVSKDSASLKTMFEGFDEKKGEGYELCLEAYGAYCGTDCETFEELFDLSLAIKAFDDKD
ncbi:MAG: hypothetical protein K6E32_02475 [Lachnospiraceae bacterium]|nr:hypothetical protein [Lachnospiraceae bacterium]